MKLNEIGKGGRQPTFDVEIIVNQNPHDTVDVHEHDVLEQDNTSTLRNADKAREIINRLKQR